MSNTESAEVILVGSELTSGDVDDVNGPFIVQKLLGLGIGTSKISIVGDHEWSIEEAINSALKAIGTHLIIIVGGLGPTSDDITSKIAAKVTGSRLVISNEALEHIRKIMAARGKEMHHSQERQSLLPQKAVIINNPAGTACAYKLHHKGKLLIFLPGVPGELTKIFDDVLIPQLKEEISVTSEVESKTFHTFGLSEMKVQEMISTTLKEIEGLKLSYLPSLTEVTVKISAEGKEREDLINKATTVIREELGDFIFGEDDDTMESTLGNLLSLRRKNLSLAESCTGGAIGSKITNVPGSSAYFPLGIVAYSNDAKSRLLGVGEDLIKEHGAVSSQVALAMAQGVRKIGRADYGLSVTGIAGPSGGSSDKPIGTVYIALSSNEGDKYKGFQFSGSREDIRLRTTQAAMELLRRAILSS